MSRAGSLTQNTKHGKTVGFAEECMGTAERPSGTEPDSPAASKPAVLEGDNPHSKPLAVPANRDWPKTCTLEMNHQGSTTSMDMDCLICFNNYNIYRVPKLLDCQHTFCAICLKLILRKEKNTWIITCPLCRKPTWVSEGLIRTLPNKENILEHLENLEWNPEVHIPAKGLDSNSWAQSSQDILNTEDIPADSSLAVQRLVLLLLLGVILTIIILPFVYLGRVKWVKMEEKWKGWVSKQHQEAEQAGEKELCVLLGRQLGEPGRFAYAALCGISLAWLFPENEQSSFRTEFIQGFVKWLDLPDAVLPAMAAFAGGLGGEGTETFTDILLKDPILKENPVAVTQDLLSFSLRDGYYDARARVLICHINLLLRIPLEELEVLEESLLESLKEQKEEESESAEVSRKKKERRKKLKRYLLIGLASVGGGTVIEDQIFNSQIKRNEIGSMFPEKTGHSSAQSTTQSIFDLEIIFTEVSQRIWAEIQGLQKAPLLGMPKARGLCPSSSMSSPLPAQGPACLGAVRGGWFGDIPVAPSGLTGGLAAPLVAAGAAAIIGSAGAAALGSTAGIAVLASLFGAAGAGLTGKRVTTGAGLTGYKMKKCVGAIEEFEFLPLTEGKQLHITIAITGWLCAGKYGSFTAPWSSLLQSREQYCLGWESKYLMELGSALDTLLNGFVNMMAQEALKFTVLSGIVTALTWPTSLLTVASVIDNPWGVCLHRSAEVGKHLAHILLSRQQGKRPVTLIGFSLGARVIYFCLQEMAQEKDCQGIIEDVVLLGAPVEGEAKHWKVLTKVVSGRIINGYCRGDWLLRFVYRTSSVQLNVAGVQPVDLDDRRMVNMDLSSVVNGHLDYMKQMDTILKAVGVKTRECPPEEKGSGSLFPPLALKSQREAGGEAQGEENTGKEEDGAGGEAAPAGFAHRRDSSSSLRAEPSLPCPGCAHNTDGEDQERQEGEISAERLGQR
ncbi:hypothetical protein WISP_35074 [Willisornis vidua]|uniref:RING-type domain-containing protein n=1 Tax=Willisornis vidua TaxID=1566151 RepID=A0ABQ9DLS2_9PASS|nr:hypothetical protein WISP_35074 [Willisornis vidua]